MVMKIACIPLILVLSVLAGGCTAAPPAVPPAPETTPVIPNLTGTWTGPMQGYDQGSGFSDYPDLAVSMIVSEQHGRIFAGTFVFTANGTETVSGFAGAIGRDGRTFTIAEELGGYCAGEVLGADKSEMIYREDGSPYSIAIDSFRRIKGP
jgi:hypothetical protein